MRSVLENEDVGRVDLRELVEIRSQVSFKVQLCRDRYRIAGDGSYFQIQSSESAEEKHERVIF